MLGRKPSTGTNRWGQAKGGWSPFAQNSPKALPRQLCSQCGGSREYDAFDRARNQWFTYKCNKC